MLLSIDVVTNVLSLSMFIPVLLRECYSTPCNVRVCLTGWMRSVTVRVVRVGVHFLKGSIEQSHSYHASACKKKYTAEGEICRLNIVYKKKNAVFEKEV